jgi:hypothetical protein
MWKRIPISDEKRYVLSLCQNARGHRYCAVTEAGTSAPDMVLQTTEIPADLVRRYAVQEIERLGLADGGRFVFGPHGEWFTLAENEALAGDWDSVPWITKRPPALPPK